MLIKEEKNWTENISVLKNKTNALITVKCLKFKNYVYKKETQHYCT